MMPHRPNASMFTLLITCLSTFGLMTLWSCTGTSQPAAYYVMAPQENLSADLPPLADLAVGVGPVKLPKLLDRPHIVTRTGQHRMAISEFHRWGDSLKEQVTGTLVENLSTLLQTPHVSAYPWERAFKPGYQLYVDIRRFDGRIGGPVVLSAVWWVIDYPHQKRLKTQRFSTTIPIEESGFDGYVAAQNSALEQMSRLMAKSLFDVVAKSKN